MFKQLQELERQKKLRELNNNVINPMSLMRNGIPVRDASQMFMFGNTSFVSRNMYASSEEFGGGRFSGTPENVAANEGLDPLEQKILSNTEDNMNIFENKVRSIQNGSLSGLMKSAAASGEAVLQEEWSGLSFQKPELSNENHHTNLPKPEVLNASNTSSSFPGFHHFQNLNSTAQASHNNSSPSKYFGLRLAPPIQRPVKIHFDPSQISQEPGAEADHSYVTNQLPAFDHNASQQVASSTRQPNGWVDVPPAQQNLSCMGNSFSKTFLGKESFPGNPEASSLLVHHHVNKPPWLKNHEASRNEPLPSMHDTRSDNNAARLVGRSPERLQRNSSLPLANLAGNGQHGSVTHLSSPYLHHLDMANQNMVVLKSKKRKIPTFDPLPWHKEVTEGCSRLDDIIKKLKEETEDIDDSHWMVQSKRRLVLTTQLMQLLFRPAPAAGARYDTVTYYVAKFACGLASHARTGRDAPNSSPGKNINSQGSGDRNRNLSNIIEGFVDRSKRLEYKLSRLENGVSSFLDARMEFQDLEKFSIINRFVKFHGRGPLVAADTASSGGAATMPKLCPQRYVIASPMPRTVPEGRHCLLL